MNNRKKHFEKIKNMKKIRGGFMVTCKDVFELDSMRGARLVGGRKGMDREVSWSYTKHTNSITEWVHGGEFMLISGYESGFNEEKLLSTLIEAKKNNLSGILLEGGINFKKCPESAIKKADELNIPLFFVPGVCIFVDISREITMLIMENYVQSHSSTNLLSELMKGDELSTEKVYELLMQSGIDSNSSFVYAIFSIQKDENFQRSEEGYHKIFRKIKKRMDLIFAILGVQDLHITNTEYLGYLFYAEDRDSLQHIMQEARKICQNFELNKGSSLIIAFSDIFSKVEETPKHFNEAYFTLNLISKKIIKEDCFSEIGSYQFVFFVSEKEKLIKFRDKYLMKILEADQDGKSQFLKTLRKFLENNGNMLRTAEQLYIHRNTLQYRLDRIKKTSNWDLNDAATRMNILNAFMITDVFPLE